MSYRTYRSSLLGNTRGKYPGYGSVRTLQNTTLDNSFFCLFHPYEPGEAGDPHRSNKKKKTPEKSLFLCLPLAEHPGTTVIDDYTYPVVPGTRDRSITRNLKI